MFKRIGNGIGIGIGIVTFHWNQNGKNFWNLPTASCCSEKQPNLKRKDYLSWKDYFMEVACSSGQRSKDPTTQVGACIVDEKNIIVGTGYNGMPNGISDDEMPSGKEKDDLLKSKHAYEPNHNQQGPSSSYSYPTLKRADYLSWDDYFMAIAFLSGQRSKDPSTQVGACIVDDKHIIVGTGYNGMPNGMSDDEMPWGKSRNKDDDWLQTKSPYVCHAEMNAVMNKNCSSIQNCTIYVSLFPCNECAKVIIQAGIKEVVYYSDKHRERKETRASKIMLEKAGMKTRQHKPRDILIDFETINQSARMQSSIIV